MGVLMSRELRRAMVGLVGLAPLLASGCDDFLMLGHDGEVEVAVPERVVSRLNRTEYDNTVRDLFGTTLRPARNFPADDFGYGFDNIAATLSMSPLHVEMYDGAAHELVTELYGERTVTPSVWRVEAEEEGAEATGGAVEAAGRVLFGGDAVHTRIYLPHDGSYTAATLVTSTTGASADVALSVDDVLILEASVGPEQRLEATVDLAAGYHTLEVAFLGGGSDDELLVDVLEVSGPFDLLTPPPALAEQILSCTPGEADPSGGTWTEPACAEHIVTTFGRRAWRRPLSRAEVDAQLSVYGDARAAGGSFDVGVRAALEALLVSPYFLYRVELDPPGAEGTSARVDGYVLASRLSYFLWSSTPDDRLLDLAAAGRLQDDAVLAAEVDRMLADPRAASIVENLGGQWLGLRKIPEASPDADAFPEVDAALRRAMEGEIRSLLESVFLRDAPLGDLLTSTQAELEPNLAAFYGVSAPDGVATVPDRPGLLTRAGWLMSTSHPTRTSPVQRGAWVLDKILCTPPPPAPAGIPALDESGGASVVEQLAQHRSDPACAACHDAMDPIGIGLESFDAVGRARTQYEDGQPVQVAGTLEGGGDFTTTGQLLDLLAEDPRIETCAVEQTFTYAMGRPPQVQDQDLLEELRHDLVERQSFRGLVHGIVMSRPFRERAVGRSE